MEQSLEQDAEEADQTSALQQAAQNADASVAGGRSRGSGGSGGSRRSRRSLFGLLRTADTLASFPDALGALGHNSVTIGADDLVSLAVFVNDIIPVIAGMVALRSGRTADALTGFPDTLGTLIHNSIAISADDLVSLAVFVNDIIPVVAGMVALRSGRTAGALTGFPDTLSAFFQNLLTLGANDVMSAIEVVVITNVIPADVIGCYGLVDGLFRTADTLTGFPDTLSAFFQNLLTLGANDVMSAIEVVVITNVIPADVIGCCGLIDGLFRTADALTGFPDTLSACSQNSIANAANIIMGTIVIVNIFLFDSGCPAIVIGSCCKRCRSHGQNHCTCQNSREQTAHELFVLHKKIKSPLHNKVYFSKQGLLPPMRGKRHSVSETRGRMH